MYYLVKAIGRGLKRQFGLRTFPPHRYESMFEEIDRLRPRTILEIGTNDGITATYLFKRAARFRDDVEYYGFDLFEQMDAKTFLHEFTLPTPSLGKVERFLERNGLKHRRLVAGNTTQTLAAEIPHLPPMDLVFIDGGHSEETVASDWRNVQGLLHRQSVVFFDDYPNFGIPPVVDSIDRRRWDVQIMPREDVYPVNPRFGATPGQTHMSVKLARVTAAENKRP